MLTKSGCFFLAELSHVPESTTSFLLTLKVQDVFVVVYSSRPTEQPEQPPRIVDVSLVGISMEVCELSEDCCVLRCNTALHHQMVQ